MLFLTFGNIVLYAIQWLNGLYRQRLYREVMNRVLRTSSFIIKRTKKVFSEGSRRTSLLPLASNEKLEYEDDFLNISSADKLYEIDLSSWTSYTSYLDKQTNQSGAEDNIFVMLEAKRPKDVEKFADKELSIPPLNRVHLLKHGCPIAWKSAEPFGIILRCSFEGLLILTDAFGQGHLSLDEDLQLLTLIGVKTKGNAQNLVFNEDDYTGGKLTEDVCDVGMLHVNHNNDNSKDKNVLKVDLHRNSLNNEKGAEVEQELEKCAAETSHNKPGTVKEQMLSLPPEASVSTTNDNSSQRTLKKPTKPPNILVYCGVKDAARTFTNIKSSLESIVNCEAYTIYHLTHEAMLSAPWMSNTALLIISSCPQLQSQVEDKILDYTSVHNGRLLSFNSSIDSKFCTKSMEEGMIKNSLLQFKFGESQVTTFRGPYYYIAENEDAEIIVPYHEDSNSLGTADQIHMDRKCFVLKTCGPGSGVVVLSQLLLERDPAEYASDTESFVKLKQANAERLEVFRELLTTLGIDTSLGQIPALTPCHLFVRRVGLKESFLNSIKPRLMDENISKSQKVKLNLVESLEHEATAKLLPVVTNVDCDIPMQYFQPSEYWHNLKTSTLGQIVFYTEVIPTTMTIFDGILFSIPENIGVIAIAGRQTSGKGRGGNAWLSPKGCAMFTLPVQLKVGSKLAQHVSFLQHMVSLAVVKSVVTLPGYQDLDLKLKWPNDIYYGKEMKLGGVLVTSTIMNTNIYATIGCGFNVSNSNPTICINDIIRLYNTSNPSIPYLSPLSTSQLIARTVTILENLIDEFNSQGHQTFCEQYYKYWLHSGVKVTVQADKLIEGEIVGLDEHGFLSVLTIDGKLLSVQPDGNSFDMMHNLIYVKSS